MRQSKKFVLFALTLILACQQKPQPPKETLLAKVGDRTISVNEFIRRAEYTMRPAYCRGDNYIHRKIVLNSLIAEKLLALEAGEQNELTENFEFQQYILGRKEQAMRQMLFYDIGVKPVKLDSSEIAEVYKVAGRVYNVSFINCPTLEAAREIKAQVIKGKQDFDELAKKLNPKNKTPVKEIEFDSEEPDVVNATLYTDTIRTGQIIGPLKVDRDNYLILKVNGWRNFVAFTDQQKRDRWKTVADKLTERKALINYQHFIGKIMAGKNLQFNPQVFRELVEIYGPEYFKSDKEKKDQFNKKFWQKDNPIMVRDDAQKRLQDLADKPFFTIDGKTWTVADFQKELLRHPLVFRKKRFPKNKFAIQFKLAVVDMVRDFYLTEEAYKRGYDRRPEVKRNFEMWRDNLLALYQKRKILEQAGVKGKNNMQIIKQILDPYLAKLREKYQDQIEINTDAFEKIKLTRIDMFVIQPNQAFPVLVPSFPQVTTHNKLDYGKKMVVPKS